MADYDFDVLVIGAGPGGYVAAIRAAQLGLKTACAEGRETLGGTCLNVGCIPSKALLHASELYEEAAHGALAKFGIELEGARLNLEQMHAEKKKAVGELTGGIEYLFKKNKVEWLKGYAAFENDHSVKVGDRTVTARDIIIATGSSVMPLPGVEVDNDAAVIVDLDRRTGAAEGARTSGGDRRRRDRPRTGQRVAAPRRKVTVVEYADQILPGFDGEVRRESAKLFKKQGMELKTSTKVTGASVEGGTATLTLEPAAGGDATTLTADAVLVSIGRRANTDGLALDKAGLTVNQRGQVDIDEEFRTGVDGIWAIGDVVHGPMLAHKAEDEGVAAAEFIAGQTGIVNHDVIPSVVYTMPEIAGVGLTEEAAKEKGEVKVGKFPFAANSRAKTNRDTDGFVKVIADAKTDKVLGVWIVSSLAGTMIAQAAQAMEFGATSEDIAYTCHAHPTHAEALKEAAMAVQGKPIHI
ncbi:dihydrolipoyl dehydrogenase family protein [Sphingomonas hankookensis]|uniref:dihydrolipoyl dehydrogenase family protein n=1 Tax=Sphingomonas hankookensis TaxID=563996 RepID=UPI003D302B7A